MMTPTLFSVSYAGLWGQAALDLESFLRKTAQLGYPAVELMGKRPHLSILETDEEKLESIARTAKNCDLDISTIAGYTDFTAGKTAAEVPFVEMQVAYVRDLSRIGKQLGAKILRVFTGYATDPDSYVADWNECTTAVRECAAVAEDFGLVLGIQNHHDVGVAWEAYAEFLDAVDHPNCKAMFDPWAPALHGDDLEACARVMAPRMVQTTLADYVRMRQFSYVPGLVSYREMQERVLAVPLGEGFVDLEAFFSGLKQGGFSGYVAYEMCSPLRGGGSEANLDASATRSLEKIRELVEGS